MARGSHLLAQCIAVDVSVCMYFCTNGSHRWVLFCTLHFFFYITVCAGHSSTSAHVDSSGFLRDHSVFYSMDCDLFTQSSLDGCLSTCLQQKCDIFDSKITKLYWSKEMPPDGNSYPQEQLQNHKIGSKGLIEPLHYCIRDLPSSYKDIKQPN